MITAPVSALALAWPQAVAFEVSVPIRTAPVSIAWAMSVVTRIGALFRAWYQAPARQSAWSPPGSADSRRPA